MITKIKNYPISEPILDPLRNLVIDRTFENVTDSVCDNVRIPVCNCIWYNIQMSVYGSIHTQFGN